MDRKKWLPLEFVENIKIYLIKLFLDHPFKLNLSMMKTMPARTSPHTKIMKAPWKKF